MKMTDRKTDRGRKTLQTTGRLNIVRLIYGYMAVYCIRHGTPLSPLSFELTLCRCLSLIVLYHTPDTHPIPISYCIHNVGISTSISLGITAATAARWRIIFFHVNQRFSTRRTIRKRSHFGTTRYQEGWNTWHGSGWGVQQWEISEGIRISIRSKSYDRLYRIHT
jgi:hypothetical protein